MADRKISELPAAALPLTGTELVAVVQGGETRQAPAEQLSTRFTPVPSVFVAATRMGGSGQTPTANRMFVVPYTPRRRMTVQRFQIRTHFSSGDSNFALAIYASGPNGLPTGSPIFAGTQFTPNYPFSFVGYAGLSFVLEPRRYWLAFVASATAGQYTETSDEHLIQEIQTNLGFTFGGTEGLSSPAGSVHLFRDGVAVGDWPTLTEQFSDFGGMEPAWRAPAFSFQVAP
ncbi:MAG: hypothetical protein ACRCTO_09415 [Pseudomonas paracarnis]